MARIIVVLLLISLLSGCERRKAGPHELREEQVGDMVDRWENDEVICYAMMPVGTFQCHWKESRR